MQQAGAIQTSLFDLSEEKKVVRIAPLRRAKGGIRAIPNPARIEAEVLQLLARRGHLGVVADDVYQIGKRLGVCAEADRATQRTNSWTGPFLRSMASFAKQLIVPLARVDGSKITLKSHRDVAGGNDQIVYVLPKHFDAGVAHYTKPKAAE